MDGYKDILRKRRIVRIRLAQLGTNSEDSQEERRAAEREREQDTLAWKLKELTRLAHGARRRWNKYKKAALETQLVEAERAGRFATVYKPSRLPSGKSEPKRRQHRAVKRHQTVEQWEKELSAPGHQGGIAVACSFGDEWARWTSTATHEEKKEPDANAYAEAERLVRTLGKRFATCDKRRVAPPWSVSNEVWVQVLLPDWRRKTDAAIGASDQRLELPLFREFLTRTLAQTIATKQAPLIDRSKGADVAKPNGELRLLHVLCTFWTQVYSIWFKAWENSQQRLHWEHGFFRQKKEGGSHHGPRIGWRGAKDIRFEHFNI